MSSALPREDSTLRTVVGATVVAGAAVSVGYCTWKLIARRKGFRLGREEPVKTPWMTPSASEDDLKSCTSTQTEPSSLSLFAPRKRKILPPSRTRRTRERTSNPSQERCPKFQAGFCPEGKRCQMRHYASDETESDTETIVMCITPPSNVDSLNPGMINALTFDNDEMATPPTVPIEPFRAGVETCTTMKSTATPPQDDGDIAFPLRHCNESSAVEENVIHRQVSWP